MFPVGARFKLPVLVTVTPEPINALEFMLAPVMLPVADIDPPVRMLAPVIFPAAVSNPLVLMFAPVTLPVADTNPVMLAPESHISARRLPEMVLPVKNFTVFPAVCVAMPRLPPLTYRYPSLGPKEV